MSLREKIRQNSGRRAEKKKKAYIAAWEHGARKHGVRVPSKHYQGFQSNLPVSRSTFTPNWTAFQIPNPTSEITRPNRKQQTAASLLIPMSVVAVQSRVGGRGWRYTTPGVRGREAYIADGAVVASEDYRGCARAGLFLPILGSASPLKRAKTCRNYNLLRFRIRFVVSLKLSALLRHAYNVMAPSVLIFSIQNKLTPKLSSASVQICRK